MQVIDAAVRARRAMTPVAGDALGAVSAAVARWTPREKPLHPRGVGLLGLVHRHGVPGAGAEWIEQDGRDEALVRISRSAGFPSALPDVWGLALAVGTGGGVGHLLLSTGLPGPVGRYCLAPYRAADGGTYGCVVPFVTSAGPLFVAAVPDRADGRTLRTPADIAVAVSSAPLRFTLRYAHGRGPWATFGELVLDRRWSAEILDPSVHFEPTRCLPGLQLPPGFARLRDPAYRRARRAAAERADRGMRLAWPGLPAQFGPAAAAGAPPGPVVSGTG